jgi:hypothetical protein
LDGRGDVIGPDVAPSEGAKKRDPEQRERDQRLQDLERDRARLREQVVLAERVDPDVMTVRTRP